MMADAQPSEATALAPTPFHRIVVATDFSPQAAAALERALLLPLGDGARIDVVHVVTTTDDAAETDAARRLASEIARVRDRIPRREVSLVASCARGQPHAEIMRNARARDAELIVLGAHGGQSWRDRLLGTTASKVPRMGEVPTLIVKHPATAPYQNALVAIALVDSDGRLVRTARRIGRGAFTAVHVVHVPFEGFQATSSDAREELRATYREDAEAKMRELLAPHGVDDRWEITVRAGEVERVLIEEAAVRSPDLMVLGTHGRTGIAHAIKGSIAQDVVAAVPCDVLVGAPTPFALT